MTSWERNAEGGRFSVWPGAAPRRLYGMFPGYYPPATSGTAKVIPRMTTLQIPAYLVTFSGLFKSCVTVNLTSAALVLYLKVFRSRARVPELFSPTLTCPRRSQLLAGSSAATCTSTRAGVYVSCATNYIDETAANPSPKRTVSDCGINAFYAVRQP